jgi:septum formation protein
VGAPWNYVLATATHKAKDVAGNLLNRGESADLIIAADTVVVLEGRILEKPSGPEHAKQMLESLSGTEHSVYTGMVLLLPANQNDRKEDLLEPFHVETKVRFAKLSPEEIDAYVATGEPL